MKFELKCKNKIFSLTEGITLIGGSIYADILTVGATPIHLAIYVRGNNIEASSRGTTLINGLPITRNCKLFIGEEIKIHCGQSFTKFVIQPCQLKPIEIIDLTNEEE